MIESIGTSLFALVSAALQRAPAAVLIQISPSRLTLSANGKSPDASINLHITNRTRSSIAICRREDCFDILFETALGKRFYARLKRFEDKFPPPEVKDFRVIKPNERYLLVLDLGPQEPAVRNAVRYRVTLRSETPWDMTA